MKTLPIYETFHSWQGEGLHLGRSACFIRLHGCPLHCPWCDSAGTWHPDYTPTTVRRLHVDELVAWVREQSPELVVLTGGEPAIHDLCDLTAALQAAGFPVHLETSGAFPLKGSFDWITLSPKRVREPLPQVLAVADEQKWIIEKPEDLDYWWNALRDQIGTSPVWLHPEWSRREDANVLVSITNWIKRHKAPFRAGWQLHKLFRADELDPCSAQAVPLGGNPKRGY